MKTAYDIIIRPIITEQSMEDLDIKKYAFEVAKDANKIEIKKAIEEIFGVTVINPKKDLIYGLTHGLSRQQLVIRKMHKNFWTFSAAPMPRCLILSMYTTQLRI